MEIYIPFSGFYESIHYHNIQRVLEDDNGDLPEEYPDWFDWGTAMMNYSRKYAEAFSREIGIPLTFKGVDSPKEYNFRTDEIICEISDGDAERLRRMVDYDRMKKYVKDNCTSYDGFMSFLSNDYDKWGVKVEVHERDEHGKPIDTTVSDGSFNEAQVGVLLACYTEQKLGHRYDWEHDLVEDFWEGDCVKEIPKPKWMFWSKWFK